MGEVTHLSLSFGPYSGVAIKPVDEYWKVVEGLKGQFLHFCDEKHLAAFLKEKIKNAKLILATANSKAPF